MILPSRSHALDVSVGANTWYTYWNMDSPESQNPKFKPGWLYGPLLSLRFLDDWSVSSVFLYGKFSAEQYLKEITRYDSDTSLNYAINRYFKIFAGYKYMGFKWENEDMYTPSGTHRAQGPGAGVALTFPIKDTLFFLFNVSGLYLMGKEKSSTSSGTVSSDLTETGFNSTASLAYYFKDIATSLMLGFRTQYVKIDYKEKKYTPDTNMIFYGATLSAVYSFDI